MIPTHHDDVGEVYEPSVGFDYDAIDGLEQDHDKHVDAQADAAVVEIMQTLLGWFCGFLFYSKDGSAKAIPIAYKRLIAMVLIHRPDLLEGMTLDDITAQLGESRNALSRWTAEITYMLEKSGVNQQDFAVKVRHRKQKLDAFDASRKNLPTTVGEWLAAAAKAP